MSRKRGGQPGNSNSSNDNRKARRALDLCIKRMSEGKDPGEVVSEIKPLVLIWAKHIEQAAEGNTASANMIIDRLDGKPGQSIDQTISAGEGVSFNMSFIAKPGSDGSDATD